MGETPVFAGSRWRDLNPRPLDYESNNLGTCKHVEAVLARVRTLRQAKTAKGKKKALDATINLVPFIDLMAVTISFLIVAAAVYFFVVVPVNHLPEGWYLVYWRVVSVDGHPVSGTFAFGVGVPAGTVGPNMPRRPTPMPVPLATMSLVPVFSARNFTLQPALQKYTGWAS